jgi:hypothetical protein
MDRDGRHGPLIEQQSLLGGVDLVRPGAPAGQTVHVDARWKVGFAAALALVVEHGRRTRSPASEPPAWTRCPRCHRVGPQRLPRQASWLDH